MSEVRLDWAAAEVKGGELRVPLSEKPPKEWTAHFETTVRLLGGGDWGEIRLKKNRVRVSDVTEGDEEKVQFFLEGALDQANTAIAPDEDDEDEDEQDDGDEESGPDAEMTKRFRAFAADAEDAERTDAEAKAER